jgi:hypothetical protein
VVGVEGEEESERKVEQTAALLVETVDRFLQGPLNLVAETAREDLLSLRQHLEETLDVLAQTEGRRELTDGELAYQHAFGTLLEVLLLDDTK